jgi:hypothetical protein
LWAHANHPRCCAISLPNRKQDYSDLGLRGNRRERVVREIEHGSLSGDSSTGRPALYKSIRRMSDHCRCSEPLLAKHSKTFRIFEAFSFVTVLRVSLLVS